MMDQETIDYIINAYLFFYDKETQEPKAEYARYTDRQAFSVFATHLALSNEELIRDLHAEALADPTSPYSQITIDYVTGKDKVSFPKWVASESDSAYDYHMKYQTDNPLIPDDDDESIVDRVKIMYDEVMTDRVLH